MQELYCLKSKDGYYYGFINYMNQENIVLKTKILSQSILYYKHEVKNAKKIIFNYDNIITYAIDYEIEKDAIEQEAAKKLDTENE
jgi:hypothetical protein